MRRPGLWASCAAPPIVTGPSPDPTFMPRCARPRRRRTPDPDENLGGRVAEECETGHGRIDRGPREAAMAEPGPKLRDLFCKAAEYATALEQAAYLDEACGGDTDLRAQLEELLAAQREAGSFL